MKLIMNSTLQLSNHHFIQKAPPILLAALLFLLPISSSGKSIFLGLSLGAILLVPGNLSDLTHLFSKAWCKSLLFLFSLVLIGCLWSPATFSEKLFVIQKYSKLLYLPILVLGFRDSKTRYLALHAFILSMVIVCGISIIKYHGYLSSYAINPNHVFRGQIMIGHFAAFAAYLSILFFCRQSSSRVRIIYAAIALILSYQLLFISQGRTGYVIYTLLMLLLIVQQASLRQMLVIMPLFCALIMGCYIASPVMRENSNLVLQNIEGYKHDMKDTHVGYRLQFHQYAYELFKRHPLLGNGTASFTFLFYNEKPIPSWPTKLLEPHNQYWLIAAEFGLLGLIAFILFFIALFKAVRHLDEMKLPAIAALVAFIIGNLSDSLLFYSGSGYFFLIMMAIFLGESLNYKKPNNLDCHKQP